MNRRYDNAKLLQTLTGHTSDVTSCDFAPNFTIITGSSDKTVRLWDWHPQEGYKERELSPLLGHKYGVTCVRVSPQGCMLASASVDGTTVLWNVHSGKKIQTLAQVNGDAVRACRFAPDSSVLVTAGDNGAICLWDLVHRSLLRTILYHKGTTQSLAFTPDSQYLVSACSLEIMNVWSVQDLVDTSLNRECTPTISLDNVHDLGVFCVDISNVITTDEHNSLVKHYTLASSGNGNEIKIWTITCTIKPKHANTSDNLSITLNDTYDGHNSTVTCVKYNNNGTHLVSSSIDKLIKIWDNSGCCVVTLDGHTRYINCVAFSRESSLVVSGSNDKTLFVWDLTGNLSLDSELVKLHVQVDRLGNIQEHHVVQTAEENNNEVDLLEKLDDISDGAINSCCFCGKDILATGAGDKLVKLLKISGENNNVEELSYSPLEGHTYAINHVEFSNNGEMLASCSLDGGTIIWNATTGEKLKKLPKNSLGVKVCRFSPDGGFLVTAGDDENAWIWDTHSNKQIITLDGHLDAVTSACFSPDNNILITASNNAHFILWTTDNFRRIYLQEDAHDLGIQSCDFSGNLEPMPNLNLSDVQTYLLATCGNDSFVKLWDIAVPKKNEELDNDNIEVKLWRTLKGHGGNVICVRFSPLVGEILCSTATDRQARLWSVYSAECLFVLDHDSIVTCCSFNSDCSLLATGCLDKTLWLWKLPEQIVFNTVVGSKIKLKNKALINWNTNDVIKWLKTIDFPDIAQNVLNSSLNGQKLMTYSEEQIAAGLDLNDEQSQRLIKEIKWLKQDELQTQPLTADSDNIPHEFLCPITHEIMREPVMCSDGFTYEKKAIVEWFVSGKYTSPMTNEKLSNTDYKSNHELRNKIHQFLYEDI